MNTGIQIARLAGPRPGWAALDRILSTRAKEIRDSSF